MNPCASCALRKYELFVPMTEAELAFMKDFRDGEYRLEAGEVLFHEGDETDYFYTVWTGQGARYKHLANGDRQLVNFFFPGDLVGLQALLCDGSQTTAIAASPMILCRFRKANLHDLFRENPARAYDLTWLAAIEEHFLGETIVTLGQRTAAQRLAWALLRIEARLKAVGLMRGSAAFFPFRQRDLADALGLSLVHTNKTLGRLRAYATWEGDLLRVINADMLADIAMVNRERPAVRPLL